MKAKITIDKNKQIGEVDKRLFGSFIEHLGRAVYGGIYEPTHETADDMGFRGDVMKMVQDMEVPIVRYPGGNFVSGYNWEDGTGPKEKRPKKLELAWNSVETNEVGVDEFQEWAKRANTEVMMAVNLGTRGPQDAANLVEYCNSKTDTYYAAMRKANGFEEPFGFKLWCLGNEMDGPWQIGAKTANEYARLACETAKMMKLVDPSIELVACGSSSPTMPTFGEWERTVLRECFDHIDYISLHNYFGNPNDNSAEFLGSSVVMEGFIKSVIAMCDEIAAEKKSEKKINVSFDEWNVWFHSNEQDKKQDPWQIAPPLLEDVYNLEDALVVGSLMITLLKYCDRVKIGCLAQLVNVIAPIMTKTGGGIWAQTIYYPFLLTSKNGRGTVLTTDIACDKYDAGELKDVPYVDSVAVLAEDGKHVNVFAINRSLEDSMELDLAFEGFENAKLVSHTVFTGDDLKAINTLDNPNAVMPKEAGTDGPVVLEKQSWNMLVYAL